MYKVVGIVKDSIRIEFSNKEQPVVFSTKEEAAKFKQYIKENEICPDGCELVIEDVKQLSEK